MSLTTITNIYVFFIGSLFGSFLNVIIHRLPLKKDFIFERSHCPSCNTLIPWYLNIPFLGYIFQKGRCRVCKVKINERYFFVELITGLFTLWLFQREGGSFEVLKNFDFYFFFVIFCIFVCHFFIDLKHKILPDSLNLILLLLIIIKIFLDDELFKGLWGFLLGFGGTFSITMIFYYIKGQIGLGGGDIKLYGILGLYLGPIAIVHNIFLSCFLGSIIMLFLIAVKKLNKKDPIAFGPFILLVGGFQIYLPDLFTSLISKYLI